MTSTVVLPSAEDLPVLWTWSNPYGALSQPLVLAGDRLIGAASSGSVFAVDVYHGSAPGIVEQVPQQGFPFALDAFYSQDPKVVADDGSVYLIGGSNGDSLVALRLADAQPVAGWTPPTVSNVESVFCADGGVVVISTDTAGATVISGYDRLTGAAGFGPVTLSDQSPGAITYGLEMAAFTVGGSLTAVNVDFGDTRWTYAPPTADGGLDSSVTPLITGTLVVAAAANLVAADIARGQQQWAVAPTGSQPVKWYTPVPDATGTTLIATNSGGDILGISAADGSVTWQVAAAGVGAPAVIDDSVFMTIDSGQQLLRLATADGAPVGCYNLPSHAGAQPPIVGNDAIFLVTADSSSIEARSFASQDAAFFDGVCARVDVLPEGDQLDFGTGDFTVEAWFKSSVGGEIVSSYPTKGAPTDHGFRLNLTADGRLRVAVVNSTKQTLNVAQTLPTGAADGQWHHVAFLRRTGAFVVLLDGQGLPMRLPDVTQPITSIGGNSGLTIGAYVAAPDEPAEAHFFGAIREVRIWNRALDVATIQTNLAVELTGQEPRLLGLWRLDENQGGSAPAEPQNAVQHFAYAATFQNRASVSTDLMLGDWAFPYLIHETAPRWPYAGTWAARGETAVTTAADLASDGTVAFGAGTSLYGVRKTDGKRAWSLGTPSGASAPVADGASFFVLTGAESLVLLDSATGTKQQVPGFADLGGIDEGFLPAPAVASGWVAAGTPTGQVTVASRASLTSPGAAAPVAAKVGRPVRSLAFAPGGLVCVIGDQTGLAITCLDPTSGTPVGATLPVISEAFCTTASTLVCIQSDGLTSWDATFTQTAPMASTTAIPVDSITGLAAYPDADLLVVATETGTVFGLSLAKLLPLWQTSIPAGPAAAGGTTLHQPVIDEAGRIYCTSASGALAVLDPGTGALVGYVTEPQAITTPALLDVGTAYFGCADPTDPTADCDGALHSFVFGQTVALRLGIDGFGAPAPAAMAYAVVEADASDATLHLMDVTTSCIEAWVNLPPADPASSRAPGGGVLGVCPSSAADAFDLNLSVDPDGTLHYIARSEQTSGWNGVHLQAATTLADGRWHHVAVSRDGQDHAVAYLDGQALTGAILTPTTDAPTQHVPGLKAYLGAIAGADLTADQPFCGMIAEVRVWDTYLESVEIAVRMNVKLRGDEPDLLAYWNFDRQAVHDSARQGQDGILTSSDQPVWWLTDLAFTLPSYPHIVTTAAITQVGDPTGTGAAVDTTYSLLVAVKRADNSGLPDQQIDLSYIRHADSEPATVTVDGVTLTGLTPGQQPDPVAPTGTAYVRTVTSRPDGTVKVSVGTALLGHGPSIDVHASFMPVDERFHVNCLIDNQTLVTPVPPSLTAQTKLIQDYSYSTGNVIDQTRDRSTHRVVLTAANPDHSVRPNEPITLWASDQLQIEVAGQAYAINADTSADFTTSAYGELAVVVAADAMSAPTLYVRTGFMHRNDRVAIQPAEDGQRQLGGVTAATLTTPVYANWKPDQTAADQQTLLSSDYQPHADDVANAVRHVMTSVQPAAAGSAPAVTPTAPPAGPTAGAGLRAIPVPTPVASFADMRQPIAPGRADSATVLRTTAYVPRQPPVNPDALRASLDGNLGFVFAGGGADPSAFRFEMLATQADVDTERGVPTVTPHALGGFFGDLWDGIKDVADDAYDAAEKVVVSITDTINVAIHALDQVVHIVVDSIEQAVDAVVNFFKQLALALELLILLLRALLDWGGIKAAGELIRSMLVSAGTLLADPATVAPITSAVGGVFDSVEDWLGVDTSSIAGQSSADLPQPGSPALDQSNGVHAKLMFHKSQDYSDGTLIPDAGGALTSPDVPPFLEKMLSDFGQGLVKLASDLPSMDFDAMATDLKALLTLLAEDVIGGARDWTIQSIESLAKSLAGLIELADTPMDIPFISAIYKWITGDDLTILSAVCFLIGFPVHVVYFVVTRGSRFSDDAQNWFPSSPPAPPPSRSATLLSAEGAPAGLGSLAISADDSSGKEIFYVVMKAVHILFVVGTDATFRNVKPSLRAWLKIGRGLAGCLTSLWTFFFFTLNYESRLSALGQQYPTLNIDVTSTKFQVTRNLGLALSLVADGTSLITGIKGVWSGGAARVWPEQGVEMAAINPGAGGDPDAVPGAVDQPLDEMPLGKAAQAEFVIAGLNAVAGVIQIAFQIESMVDQPDWPDHDLRTASRLIGCRYIFFSVPKLFGWMFTDAAGNVLSKNPDAQIVVTAVRGVSNTTALVLHATAAFGYLD